MEGSFLGQYGNRHLLREHKGRTLIQLRDPWAFILHQVPGGQGKGYLALATVWARRFPGRSPLPSTLSCSDVLPGQD